MSGLTLEEVESWAQEAARHNVRVTYRVKGQSVPTTRVMSHVGYLRFVNDLAANGYELVRAEQEQS